MDDTRRCTATNRQGERCGRAASPGLTVCYYHGAATTRSRAAAGRRLALAAAERAVATFGLPINIDPGTALLQEVQRAAGVVAYLATQVAALDPEDVVWGKTADRDGEHGYTEYKAAPNMWVILYGEWSDRLTRTSKAALDAGVAERVVRIEERRGELLGNLIAAILDDPDLGLNPDQQDNARQVAARHLLALPT